ncbi:hypothetical protein J2128_001775 [Methanomicrobium sp. W14]|uniref:GAF domain-containing sensor histidine kinase n=1 Tax=Methanomicrobium sp. W14 TaxID=2817839 RepID=UPI001AE97C2A|nr:GAF domain-containing sensor histidine kinase [Methanomicrobium sp. W14]MBP2133821.1 hypothetical protein [Methanomicrobium sp. W14]
MTCVLEGESSFLNMLDDLGLAFLNVDCNHNVIFSGRAFSQFARNNEFECGISLYSEEIGIFNRSDFRPVVESVFLTGIPVKQKIIEFMDKNHKNVHISAEFHPLSSCDNCVKSVIIHIKDDTGEINAYNHICELNRRLHAINEIMSISSSSKNPSEIIRTAVKKTVEFFNFDAGAFYCLNMDKTEAKILDSYGFFDMYLPDVISKSCEFYPYKQVYLKEKPFYSEQYMDAPHEKSELGVFSLGCVPVMAGKEIIGSLNVATTSFHKFTTAEKETLEALGRQIGGVMHLAALQKDLECANENANLYLDIMMHDINNANLISSGYLELLAKSGSESSEFAIKALTGINQSMNIIRNVSVIREIQSHNPVLSNVSLDFVISREIENFSNLDIRYSGSGDFVLCDGLLSEVFINLFGNSVKFGGDNVIIEIEANSADDQVEISVSDNGPGISDDIKPVVFDRFFRGRETKSGKGLGLFIVRMILERYGSEISISDRIPGRPSCGVKFSFTLMKGDCVDNISCRGEEFKQEML